MQMVIFGLTMSSSWGNGHATLWRGLQRALATRGWHVVFFEKDVPYYAQNRDLFGVSDGELILYPDWPTVETRARQEIARSDVVMVTSYCHDGLKAAEAVLSASRPLRVFYDLDTPVTLARLQRGQAMSYIGAAGLADYDLVLSYTGGGALSELRSRLGARQVAPLYGHVDSDVYRPSERELQFFADLAYIGTYAQDRQAALERLFLDVARQCPEKRFLVAGAQYPKSFPWSANILFAGHLPPDRHAAFYSSARLLLNVTRRDMARMGWCPSGRLFEAAACGAAIISDWWPGLDAFFAPGEEILIAETTEDVVAALRLPDAELRRLGANARRRALAEHTSDRRAAELERVLSEARRRSANVTAPMEA